MNTRFLLAPGLLLAAILAAPLAWGQKADSFDFYASDLNVLTAKEVQGEIGVTAAQRAKLNKHADWFNGERGKIQQEAQKPGANRDALNQRLNSLLSQFKTRALGELRPPQITRLREVSLQLAGAEAILDEQVSKRIGIPKAQLDKMRASYGAASRRAAALQEQTIRPIMAKYEKLKPTGDAEKKKLEGQLRGELDAAGKRIAPQLQKIYADARQALVGSMSAAQKQAFGKLLGKPFNPPRPGAAPKAPGKR